MENEIVIMEHPTLPNHRVEIIEGLLSRMNARIVWPDGSLPPINVSRVVTYCGRDLLSNGISLGAEDSRSSWLESNSEDAEYVIDPLGENFIYYLDRAKKRKKFYMLYIELAGQREVLPSDRFG